MRDMLHLNIFLIHIFITYFLKFRSSSFPAFMVCLIVNFINVYCMDYFIS